MGQKYQNNKFGVFYWNQEAKKLMKFKPNENKLITKNNSENYT